MLIWAHFGILAPTPVYQSVPPYCLKPPHSPFLTPRGYIFPDREVTDTDIGLLGYPNRV